MGDFKPSTYLGHLSFRLQSSRAYLGMSNCTNVCHLSFPETSGERHVLAVRIISAYEMGHKSSEEHLIYNRMKQQGGKKFVWFSQDLALWIAFKV